MPKFKIFGQWMEELPSWAQKFVKPSCTIPDQSMTIAEIIAKYTRTGLVPGSVVSRADDGGNIANDPGFDPMDEWNESMAAAARAEAAQAAATSATAVPEPSEPAPVGGTE